MYTIQQQLMQILILIFVLNYFEEGKKNFMAPFHE